QGGDGQKSVLEALERQEDELRRLHADRETTLLAEEERGRRVASALAEIGQRVSSLDTEIARDDERLGEIDAEVLSGGAEVARGLSSLASLIDQRDAAVLKVQREDERRAELEKLTHQWSSET